jgi:hypothetical protein
MTTFTDFVANLGDLDISGVSYLLDEPPTQLNDLPAQWVNFPSEVEGPLTFQTQGGWPTFTAQLIVAIEAVGQNTQAANFADSVTMVDNVRSALSAAIKTVVKGKLEWTMRIGEVLVGEISYWAVICDVTGHG